MYNQYLTKWGWNTGFQSLFLPHQEQGLIPGRILFSSHDIYTVTTGDREYQSRLAGSFLYTVVEKSQLPVVGDWVALTLADQATGSWSVIQAVLPRRTKISRRAPGRITEEQVLAANVDIVCLVSGLDRDYNPRRIERYLALARESGASPLLILNKADLVPNLAEYINQLEGLAPGVPLYCTSYKDQQSIEIVSRHFTPGATAILLGSSGVGKSTLVNRLMKKKIQEVQEVRSSDQRGRHTTTNRELFVLPDGGLIIDTPGLRELQLWNEGTSLDLGFEEIAYWETQCRFKDCRHEGEPGCAVQAALLAGEIPEERYLNFLKLRREQDYLNRRRDEKQYGTEKAEQKKIARLIKKYHKDRERWS